MDAYRHFCFEFVREKTEDFVLVQRLLVRPQIVEPLDDALLERLPDLAELHVAFDPVHLLLEDRPLGVHVRDHAADVTDDRREDQHADQEICHDEHVLDILFRSRCLADGRQRQRRPVERVDVHAQQRRVHRVHRLGDVEVHPVISTESDPVAHLEVYARVPVDDHQDVHDEVQNTERVRVVRARLRPVEELEHSVHAKDAVDSEVGVVRAEHDIQ